MNGLLFGSILLIAFAAAAVYAGGTHQPKQDQPKHDQPKHDQDPQPLVVDYGADYNETDFNETAYEYNDYASQLSPANAALIASNNALYAQGLSTCQLQATEYLIMSQNQTLWNIVFPAINIQALTTFDDYYTDYENSGGRKKRQLPPIPQLFKNWTAQGFNPPIYNQGAFGVCWACAGVSTIGAAWFVSQNNLPGISLQQILDCAKGYLLANNITLNGTITTALDDGVNVTGSTVGAVFVFSKKRGNALNADYKIVQEDPMVQRPCTDSTVHLNTIINDTAGVDPTITVGVPGGNFFTNAIAYVNAINTIQPIAVTLNASCPFFSGLMGAGLVTAIQCPGIFYPGGNHWVMLVGYGVDITTTPGVPIPYYIVRNSWGTNWGQNGYGRIEAFANTMSVESNGGYYPLLA